MRLFPSAAEEERDFEQKVLTRLKQREEEDAALAKYHRMLEMGLPCTHPKIAQRMDGMAKFLIGLMIFLGVFATLDSQLELVYMIIEVMG